MDKHRAKIIQRLYVERYYYGWGTPFEGKSVYRKEKYKSDEVLWEGELDSPILKEGEMIRIESLNETHEIENVVRSTEGGYVYVVMRDTCITDEETEISRLEAIKEKQEHKERERKLYEESTPWWKKMFRTERF